VRQIGARVIRTMPKERFHLYLADKVLSGCRGNLPYEIHGQATGPQGSIFFTGAISPDIFFYDLPFFSLSPLGNALHDLIERKTICIIFDWIAHTRISGIGYRISGKTPEPTNPIPQSAGHTASVAGAILWGLGFASHFLADAAWHPVIDELSRDRLWTEAAIREQGAASKGRRWKRFLIPASLHVRSTASPRVGLFPASPRLTVSGPRPVPSSPLSRHRLLESELEALRVAGSPSEKKYDDFLKNFAADRGRIFEIASYYRRFLEFAGLWSHGGPADPGGGRGRARLPQGAQVLERRIVRCFLFQNFLLRLFANTMLGAQRDRLLRLWPFLGVLVTPVRPFLPALFSGVLPEERNPFSDCFLERSLTYVQLHFCALAQRLSQIPARRD